MCYSYVWRNRCPRCKVVLLDREFECDLERDDEDYYRCKYNSGPCIERGNRMVVCYTCKNNPTPESEAAEAARAAALKQWWEATQIDILAFRLTLIDFKKPIGGANAASGDVESQGNHGKVGQDTEMTDVVSGNTGPEPGSGDAMDIDGVE
jgi:hypothetical protein